MIMNYSVGATWHTDIHTEIDIREQFLTGYTISSAIPRAENLYRSANMLMKLTKRGGQQHRNADSEEDIERVELWTGSFVVARRSASVLEGPTAVNRTLADAVSHRRLYTSCVIKGKLLLRVGLMKRCRTVVRSSRCSVATDERLIARTKQLTTIASS